MHNFGFCYVSKLINVSSYSLNFDVLISFTLLFQCHLQNVFLQRLINANLSFGIVFFLDPNQYSYAKLVIYQYFSSGHNFGTVLTICLYTQ